MENNKLLNDRILEEVNGGAFENNQINNTSNDGYIEGGIINPSPSDYGGICGGAPVPEEHVMKPTILE